MDQTCGKTVLRPPQDRRKTAQDDLRALLRRRKMLQDGPKTVQDRPKTGQDRPKPPQARPKHRKTVPREPQDGPRSPKTAQDG